MIEETVCVCDAGGSQVCRFAPAVFTCVSIHVCTYLHMRCLVTICARVSNIRLLSSCKMVRECATLKKSLIPGE